MEFTLLGAAAVAVVLLYAVLWYEAGRTNAADCTRDAWDALVTAAVAGLAVGRLSAMIRAGTNPIAHPGDILIVRAGVDTIAASITALGAFAFATRKDLIRLADAATPAALAGLAGWHGGCLVRDSCLGAQSDLPWAVAQAGSSITRHPVEIYAALLLVAAVVGLIVWKRHRPRPGLVTASGLAAAAIARLVTEPMRLGLGDSLTWWYAAAAIVTAGMAGVLASRTPRPD